jgi:hypothetical protein
METFLKVRSVHAMWTVDRGAVRPEDNLEIFRWHHRSSRNIQHLS